MRRTPDIIELLLGFGICALIALCPPLGVAVVFGIVYLT